MSDYPHLDCDPYPHDGKEIMMTYRQQVGLGCDLLDGAWPSRLIPHLFYKHMPPHPPFPMERADYAWVNAWKFMIKWGWFGYGAVAALEIACHGEGPFKLFLDWVDWLVIIWPCVIFSAVAFLARPRIGEPMLAANIWLLIHIVQQLLKFAVIVCGGVLLIQFLERLFGKK
jgi:hypothetical protein